MKLARLGLALLYLALSLAKPSTSCRYLPGDKDWPTLLEWNQLNKTVHGQLIATVPLGSPCHDPSYNVTECASLAAQWPYPEINFESPSAVMFPWVQNHSCDPFTPQSTPCILGNYVAYSINVTSPSDIAVGLKFAQKNNVRLVIKNTGHDYLGKSTGKGGLGIWTHNLKSMEFLDYKSDLYHGPAIKMGAGVQAYDAYLAASPRGLRVVGGECPTVGLAGGYTQGAGHSVLSSRYGLGADQALEWEVVIADGTLLTASPTENPDLYWALCGGGGGTYGVVVSLTSKAHPDGRVTGATLAFNSSGVSQDTYWNAVSVWHKTLLTITENGGAATTLFGNDFLLTIPTTFPDKTIEEAHALMQPIKSILEADKIPYSLTYTSFSKYLDFIENYFGPLPYGHVPTNQLTGSRLIPRSLMQSNLSTIMAAIRNISLSGPLVTIAQNVPHSIASNTPSTNAVLAAWRSSVMLVLLEEAWDFTAPPSLNMALENLLTNNLVSQIDAVSPGSGTYLNEANFQQANWKEDFYGVNYERLRSVKRKYDPEDLFYATTAVGSDAWYVAADGRLCRAE